MLSPPQQQKTFRVPPELIEDCAQLVKANSIQGNKEKSVDVVYTPWGNLKKASCCAAGCVGGLAAGLPPTPPHCSHERGSSSCPILTITPP